ncbi:MAG: hypothetical protein INR69_10985 [Mucilaginibacter polytrichastri]|nr:hypothetical protein [Mucilaginibacter polytrichastri]
MNLKRIFGTILTIAGAIGLIYAAMHIMEPKGIPVKNIIVVSVIAMIFFFTGISLIRGTKDGA